MAEPYRLLTVTTPLGDDAFTLTGLTGREEFSRPFSFKLELVAETTTAVAPADLVGKPVGWSVFYPNEVERKFHGVVKSLAACEFLGRARRVYRAEVVPWLWFLTRAADCKIFQQKTAPDIIEAVFKAFGFTGEFYRLNLTGTYPVREYCVQYRETAFAFVSRLMEEEGIFYFFEYAAGKHTMVLADAVGAYADCDPHAEPEFRPELGNAESVQGWERRHEFRSGKYAHTDYNFTTPSTSLLASTDTTAPLDDLPKYELFDYPGNHTVTADGTSRAKVRIGEVEVAYDVGGGTGRCNSFRPGGKFKLKGHAVDKEAFVLTAVEHTASEPLTAGVRGGGGDYQNTFTAIPATVVYRPERLTPRPVVEGPQTAVVVGPGGEEIYTDKYGRIKVHFHWDRYGKKNESDTCFIRVGELWAGKNWGMIFTPRIGQEVVVDFLEGNPDCPIVTGRVYNAEQMPPYALPGKMTQSGIKTRSTKTGGEADFNELRFEDLKGKEEIYFHAQKDFVRFVENDDTLTVEHDQSIEIKNNRKLVVKEGWEKITIDKGDRERTVTKGKDTLLVSTGDRSVTVDTGNETHTVTKGNLTLMVGNKLAVTAKAGMAVVVTKGGASFTVEDGDNKVQVKTGNDTYSVDTGNREVTVKTGNDTYTVETGNRQVTVKTGNDTHSIDTGNREVTVKTGNDTLTITAGNQTVKLGAGASTHEAAQSITLKCGPSEIVLKPDGITIKGLNITITGSVATKISGLTTDVAGSAMTKITGGVVMIN